jgi:hypothetical protein
MITVKSRWIWEIYLMFLILIVAKSVYIFFSSDSDLYFFFYFLSVFDKHFHWLYYINAFQIILNALSLVPLALWIYNKRFMAPQFWQAFFVLKIAFDIFGQTFDRIEIISLYHMDPFVSALLVLQYFLIYLPLYIVLFLFAFKPKLVS